MLLGSMTWMCLKTNADKSMTATNKKFGVHAGSIVYRFLGWLVGWLAGLRIDIVLEI